MVIGCLLAGTADFAEVRRSIAADDFGTGKHKLIWFRLEGLHERGMSLDRVTLAEELERRHELKSVDGLAYLASLDDGMPLIANIASYIRIMQETAGRRRIIVTADALSKRALAGTENADDLIASGARMLADLTTHSANGDAVLTHIPSAWKYEVDMSWLIDGLLLEKAVTMWSGESGDGKSTLALALAAAVAQGELFLGRRVIQRPVLYLDRENPIAIVKDRLLRLGIPDISDRLWIWGTWWQDHYPPGPDAASVITYARRVQPLIVFDSLVAFANCDENSASEMRHHMTLYRMLASGGGTVLLIHHRSEKGEAKYRGSSDIRGIVDAAWEIARDDESTAADASDSIQDAQSARQVRPDRVPG